MKSRGNRPAPASRSRPTVDLPKPAALDAGIARPSGIAARVGLERVGAILRSSQVAMAFEALGDRWSVLVLREIFLGARRFEELVAATEASRATLTQRLRSLVDEGILHRHPYQARPTRYEYRLTRMGLALYPTALMYWLWENRYGGGTGVPQDLVHRRCGATMQPLLECRACRDSIDIRGIRVEFVAEPDEHQVRLSKHCLHTGAGSWRDAGDSSVQVLDVVGDQWTALVQASAYYGLHRFADIQAALAIPTNTLSDRLKLLVRAGALLRAQYQDSPPRFAYRLTDKGRALYLSAFTLHQWADRWLLRGRVAPIRLVHQPCGNVAEGVVVCDRCHGELLPADVEPKQSSRRGSSPAVAAITR